MILKTKGSGKMTKIVAVDIVKYSGTCAIFTILLGGKSMNHGVTAPFQLKCTDLHEMCRLQLELQSEKWNIYMIWVEV